MKAAVCDTQERARSTAVGLFPRVSGIGSPLMLPGIKVSICILRNLNRAIVSRAWEGNLDNS